MPEQNLGSIDMLEVPSIQHNNNSSLDESQPICELFSDSEPVPAPVPEEQVPAKQAMEKQVQSDDDSDDGSHILSHLLLLTLFLDTQRWSTAKNNINGLVNPNQVEFQG
jgi:hypothetical protein